jgi:molecular chaperone HtpG
MKTGQEKIFYLTADTLAAAKSSPHLEVFRKKGIEVLLLPDRVDEWLMSHLTEFDGKGFASVAKGDLDISKLGEAEPQEKSETPDEDELKDLTERMHKALGERVREVRVSHRLTDSPSCLVVDEHDMAMHLQRLLREAGHELPSMKPVLEVNTDHVLVRHLQQETDEQRFGDWTQVLYEQAMLSEGGQLEDAAGYVRRVNALLQAGVAA